MMKLSQKKICGNCRALDPAHGGCDLRFNIKNIAKQSDLNPYPKYAPAEPCYKPLTYSDLMLAIDLVRKKE
jgi:hypothetical protein